MGTASSLGTFKDQINRLAAAYERTPRNVVAASARVYGDTIRRDINAVTNGGKLRNVGKRGSRVGVVVKLGVTSATVHATGPLQIIERNTQRHTIPRTALTRRTRTKTGRLSRKRELTGRSSAGRRRLFINGHWVTGPVTHPGTHGKHPFERGALEATDPAARAAQAVVVTAIAGVFR